MGQGLTWRMGRLVAGGRLRSLLCSPALSHSLPSQPRRPFSGLQGSVCLPRRQAGGEGAPESTCRWRHWTQLLPYIPPIPDSLHYQLASLLRCRFPRRVKPFLPCCAYLIRLFSSQLRASGLPTISSANTFSERPPPPVLGLEIQR